MSSKRIKVSLQEQIQLHFCLSFSLIGLNQMGFSTQKPLKLIPLCQLIFDFEISMLMLIRNVPCP